MVKRKRIDGEPEPMCANCDSWTAEPRRLCLIMMERTEPTDRCAKFFPDGRRWPEADHG
jgi:hypothetical protein